MGSPFAPFGSLLAVAACSQHDGQSQGSTATSSGSIAGTLTSGDLDSLRQDRAQWTMAAGDYASTRFSQLDEINTGNVARLKVAWTFHRHGRWTRSRADRGRLDDVPDYAVSERRLCARPCAAWRPSEVEVRPGAAKGVACCDVVNRGELPYRTGLS